MGRFILGGILILLVSYIIFSLRARRKVVKREDQLEEVRIENEALDVEAEIAREVSAIDEKRKKLASGEGS